MFIVIKSEHYDCTNLICKKDTLEEAVAAVKDSMAQRINMSRVYTFNGKMVATNRHKATEQTTDSLEEFRQRQPNDVCNLKVKEHHPTYRNMNRNYPGSVFLVGNQVHVMQGIAGSKDGEATTYKDTNANSIAAGKCKFVAKNSGILFV